MRLLQYSESGMLSTHNFDDGDIPPYAILSHTWGADSDEVTFADLQTGGSKTKLGYEKILFCGSQARHDGLQYFWIDTCCIDKNDKAELAFSIRSMFRWYRNAARCYVYLSDVAGIMIYSGEAAESSCDYTAFRRSRWFTRGWTLQELLAPPMVDFFSKDGQKLGSKSSLLSVLCEITRIPEAALQSTPLSDFSVNERISWNEHRITTIPADRAYSLMGILGVSLSPFDGESLAEAMKRVTDEVDKQNKCLQDIRRTDPQDDKKRIEDTKGGLLADSYRWVLDNPTFQQWQQHLDSRLLWVKGDPGKGKTMLLCGIIDELQDVIPWTALLLYFFCQATDSRINSATAVLRGLLYMLLHRQPSLMSHVSKKYDQAGKGLFEDTNAWVVLTEIFTDVLQDVSLGTTYLIIDALDECVTDLPKLLSFIAKQSSVSSRVKWIVSSRNWPDIEAQLKHAGHKMKLSLELNAKSVAAAVDVFIEQKVEQLAKENKYEEKLQHIVLQHLKLNANDTFLWVALVCQDLKVTPRWNVHKKLAQFPPGLDALYNRMLQQIVSESSSADMCLRVLAVTAVLYRPVTVAELVVLTEQLAELVNDLESVREIIGLCGSFLTLRDDTIYFVHQSAKDFLVTKASDKVFQDGIERVHQDIFVQSLSILQKTLHRDMYNLQAPGYPAGDVKPPILDPLAVSRYPCVYWVDHFCDSKHNSFTHGVANQEDTRTIDAFLRHRYIYWLEALSLCRSMDKGVVLMTKLWHLVQELGDTDELNKIVYDARRFIMYHKEAIEKYPLQAYASALLFSPADSIIRKLFQHEKPRRVAVKPGTSNGWSACLQTLEGHGNDVTSIAFSHDSTWLASASRDSTVKIWDASSGTCLQTLEGHGNCVNSVAFSHDSTWLASASLDWTVKIWDASSGTCCVQTLEGHSECVFSVAFSRDSTRLASASNDRTVKIWDASNGMCVQTLEGHIDCVSSVVFSYDSTWLASASHDSTVKIWDASSGKCLQTLEGHSDYVASVAFSHDSTWLASASFDCTAKIWEPRMCLHTLNGHSDYVRSVAFSHDSTRLASASNDRTVKIWDASNGTCVQTLEGHIDWVSSVTFSHDSTWLASASHDSTIKIWDASSGTCVQTLEGHSSGLSSVAFSHDSTWLASTSGDSTIRIWDASSGKCLHTLDVGTFFLRLSFDSTSTLLHTEKSTISISISSSQTTDRIDTTILKLQYQGAGISSDCKWVMCAGSNILWIPSEYRPSEDRPSSSAVSGTRVGIGVGSGRVW
ncbi:beta transducin-like protein HET-E2C*40, partial [Bipolaris maydis]